MFSGKNKNITDKAFLIEVVVHFCVICLCIAMLCFETYAWFGPGLNDESESAIPEVFEIEVGVVNLNDGVESDNVVVVEEENGVWCFNLKAIGTYKITLTRLGDLTDYGYCFLTVGDGKKQPTGMISAEEPFVFTVTTTQMNTEMSVEPWWGLPYAPVVANNGVFSIN